MRHRAVMKFKFGPAAVGIKVAKDFADGAWFGEVSKCDDEPDEDGDDVDGGIYTIFCSQMETERTGWRTSTPTA
jgi:hypothetical protein